jgi:hypothetical protein
MLIGYKRGQGSIIVRVKILNSSVATGAGLTGLSSTSSGLIISTIADTESTATAYTVAASNVETITTNGTYSAPTASKCRFKEVDSTNHKGVYEIQIADARYNVSSAKSLLISISGATNAAETDVVIPLRDLDPYDAVRAGLTSLPNVASGSAGAIITSGTGTAQLSVSSGAVTAGTVSDKTGYSLSTAPPTAAAIADAVWDEASGDHLAAGSTGAALNAAGSAGDPWTTTLPGAYTGSQAGKMLADILTDTGTTLQGELDGIQADTEDIQSRLPAALVSGRIDASVGAMASGALTAAALATDAVGEIADGVWDEPYSGHTTAGTYGGRIPRSQNSNVEVQITGSGHAAADIHELQPAVIDHTHFAAGAIDANALAASAASEIATAAYTGQMTESYRAAGVAPTLAQSLFELLAQMGDRDIVGQTLTLHRLDGTAAKTFTLNDGNNPTSITEAT